MIIKICGIRSVEAAQTAEQYGADLIGFIFAESKRKIDVATAAEIAAAVPRPGKVGVFVNQPLPLVREIAEKCRLDYIQLHGDESPEYCSALNRPAIRALRIGNDVTPMMFTDYPAEYLLLDSFVPGQAGGTGVAFDWETTRNLIGRPRQKFIVAGGLTPENVPDAIRILRPDGVDVSGGVETDGVKDSGKIQRFITAARLAAERNRLC
ncbi:MAG TPA: phosphoribosylanthranilate isomerase [Negativicutes bacterium]|nr:phosphoribosylanthranilate isomerase [Negativicutes bacterium]